MIENNKIISNLLWSGSHVFELFLAFFFVLLAHVGQYRMLGNTPYFVMSEIILWLYETYLPMPWLPAES